MRDVSNDSSPTALRSILLFQRRRTLSQDSHGKLRILKCASPQLFQEGGILLAKRIALLPLAPHFRHEFICRDGLKFRGGRLTNGVKETIDLRIVRYADERHAHDTRKNQGMKANRDEQIHIADE